MSDAANTRSTVRRPAVSGSPADVRIVVGGGWVRGVGVGGGGRGVVDWGNGREILG